MSLDRMVARYSLADSLASNGTRNQVNRERRIRAAERQNWRCCYCNVLMFAGIPTEDLHLYAQTMGIHLKKRGVLLSNAFEQIRCLRATTEHLSKQEYRGLFGSHIDDDVNIVASCWHCNSGRQDRTPLEWYEEMQSLVRSKKHPHSRYIRMRDYSCGECTWRLVSNGQCWMTKRYPEISKPSCPKFVLASKKGVSPQKEEVSMRAAE